jgi:Sulfotransferase family
MPVAIAGMHRSGSSLIARLLNLCGLDLGPEDRLMPAAKDNPEGFWESLPFVHVNDYLIGEFGGWWDRPSQPLPGWECASVLDFRREQARALPGELGLAEPWGWKDPRNSLTIPFWLSLWPKLRIVACVRHPLEAASSLLQRDRFPFGKSLNLWREYYHRLVSSSPTAALIVTHFDAFFIDPVAELTRLVEFLQLPADRHRIESACAAVVTGLRHSQLDAGELADAATSIELQQLYLRLCRDGGPVFAKRSTGESQRHPAYTNAVRMALAMEEMFESQQQRIRDLETQLRYTTHKRDEAILQIQALELRLSARRHRYADRVMGLLRRVTDTATPQPDRETVEN